MRKLRYLDNTSRSAKPLFIVATIFICLTGCQTDPDLPKQPENVPTSSELLAAHNANTDRITRLWARAVVELRWKDENGKHFEQGEGNLLAILPDNIALSIGKLGHTLFWIGCDAEMYWLFDLRDQKVLYMGRHDLTSTRRPAALPLAVSPSDLIRLLGVLNINPNSVSPSKPTWVANSPTEAGYNIESQISRQPSRLVSYLLDHRTARPIRIDLLQPGHAERITGRLSRWERMSLDSVPPGGYPFVATRIQINDPSQEGTATLFLSDVSDGMDRNRIKNKAFDLERLIKALKPEHIVDLDVPSH